MAHLGSLATKAYIRRERTEQTLPIWAATAAYQSGTIIRRSFQPRRTSFLDPSASGSDTGIFSPDRLNGIISGTVTVNSAPLPNAKVTVLDGKTMVPVARTVTNALGQYAFATLSRLSGNYLVIVQHPGGTEKAEVYDQIDAL